MYPQFNTPIIYPVYMYWEADSLLFPQRCLAVIEAQGGLQSSEIKYKPLPPLQTLGAPVPPTKYRPDTIVHSRRAGITGGSGDSALFYWLRNSQELVWLTDWLRSL